MPELDVHISPLASKDPKMVELQADIITTRAEYASWDHPQNIHEFFGILENLSDVLTVCKIKVDEQRRLHPGATFYLEYHKSCMLTPNPDHLVYSFTLQTKRIIAGVESRIDTIVSLRLPIKDDYTSENAEVESFMKNNQLDAFDDGSGAGSKITNYDEPEFLL